MTGPELLSFLVGLGIGIILAYCYFAWREEE